VLRLVDGVFVEVQQITAPGTTIGPVVVEIDPVAIAGPPPLG
jgi:hypothetical protein